MSDQESQAPAQGTQAEGQKKGRISPPTEGMPEGWNSESRTEGFRDNKDGSVTVTETVVVMSPEGKTFVGTRVMRLLEIKEKKAAEAPKAEQPVEARA